MAFSFGASNPASGNIPAELGSELPDVYAEEVGFKGVSSDSNVRLLPTPWPDDALPAPSSSLLAIAPTKGVIVGAGPDSLAIASSDAVRKAISAPTEDKAKTKPFQPQATIPLPARPTHIAFTSGDDALVLATENGSQLLVYETTSLSTGNAQPALSIPTNGATFRSLAPNPAPPSDEAHSSLVALVTTNGELLVANLKAGNLVSGPNGNVLKTGVSSVCWSNKGKQLVAGLADGTGYQMTPDGTQKDLIPRPSDLEGNCHVSSIAWLENDIFLMVYTPNDAEDETGQTPSSSYYVITRRKQAPFLIQKLPELCIPFGVKRAPAYQFMARLRDYKPHLKDVLIVSSTASTDVGLVTRSEQPLASDDAAKATINLFTTTELNDDTKRASPPLTDSGEETSVIGLGIDLSSTEVVVSPIAGEDISESSTPLPNLLLLNNEGILCSWWFIYSESIRQKLPYHGLASVAQPQQQAQPQAPKQPAFGQSAFASPSALGAPSPFGKPSAAPAFGSPSTLGSRSQPTFGAPSFGAPSQIGSQASPSFGTPSGMNRGAPQFGQSSFGSMGTPSAFGQPSTPGKGFGSFPLGTPGATSGGGFGSFASSGGFAGLAASKPAGESPFAKTTGESPFSKPSGTSGFGSQTDTSTAFGSQKAEPAKSPFGLPAGGFKLEPSFKGDGTAVHDGPKPEKPSSGLFGSFDEMVSTPTKASPPTESMDDMEDEPTSTQQENSEASKPAPSLFGAPTKYNTTAPSSLFGTPNKPQQPFGAAQTNKSPFSILGNSDKQASIPLSPPSDKTPVASPPLKKEDLVDDQKTPDASEEPPLPPDPTSKVSYGPGDTSASSNVSKSSIDDAPLPPDFTTQPKSTPQDDGGEPPLPPDFTLKSKKEEPDDAKPEEAPLPPDFTAAKLSPIPADVPAPVPDDSEAEGDESEKELSDEADESDFADSGEDVADGAEQQEEESEAETPEISPESSFGAGFSGKTSAGGLFAGVSQPSQASNQPPRQLFGEVRKPFLPPAPSANREFPRSPSPVRNGAPRSLFKPQAPGSTLAARKASLSDLAKRENQLRQPMAQAIEEAQAQQKLQAQRQQEETLSLSDDDEDERLRADLARPIEPVPTLDPFLPHQDYTGQTSKPGIPGQIERLYRDINSMVDTLGINARSLSAFLMYQQSSSNSGWVNMLQGDNPTDLLDERLRLSEIEQLDDALVMLAGELEKQRVQGVEKKLEDCRELLSKDILTLRGQCASIRKTLDAHTDSAAIVSAPLSSEQANLQQDLRTTSTDIQARLADLESAVSLLRAKIAEAPRSDSASRQSVKRPTVEAVTSTISTMMNMAESKSSDIDFLEVQLKKLGIDTTASPASREGSPFTTPKKSAGRLPTTPGSRGSIDGPVSAYHTPDSAARFRSSINGSSRASRLRDVEGVGDLVSKEESAQWKAKVQRRQCIVGNLKKAISEKKSKVRSVDDV
ncbi:nuclear pore complex subunit Nup159 [Aspergillus bombycis]|uniref:Nuclear pore complex subunit Nup159 n=1 Tax=Aspergillus bombycis TaxID=109264 RepID=A0A1F8AGF0_9EURO|nr:nuclear pore complex subunit Nup159 [Aspergillus bombycis]OGM50398.1 nuclear pore complex subunit Nup159 [Aspergillus bombycis]